MLKLATFFGRSPRSRISDDPGRKTPSRIAKRRGRLGLAAYPAGQGLRGGELAAMLHVRLKTLRWWISLAWLQVRQNRVPEESVVRFFRQHPELVEVLSSDSRDWLSRFEQPVPYNIGDPITPESLAAAGV